MYLITPSKARLGKRFQNKDQCSCTTVCFMFVCYARHCQGPMLARNEAFPFGWGHAIISCSIRCSTCALVRLFFLFPLLVRKECLWQCVLSNTFAKWIGATHRIFNVANTKGIRFERWRTENCCARILLPCWLSD